ncbi:hypothetical protein BKA82DRAFT_32123 [Pisolithus tinctorius]|uniref:Uncharacterized protein n=1 Tax=Pisolithus tinctorius Marx 270 TaxID=870435 RepID=A0A0C3IKZ9_PISTI|nr:hypothetical protein BKA82DRAFT_32123 [Pisolithus tinctorius]KIN97652.1 hypothetical protein M404DRAFT_32123 [Pisolithus tinctorius Marx 270]
MSQQHKNSYDNQAAFDDLGSGFSAPEHRVYRGTTGTPHAVQVNVTHMMIPDISRSTPKATGFDAWHPASQVNATCGMMPDVSHVMPEDPGSEVSRPASALHALYGAGGDEEVTYFAPNYESKNTLEYVHDAVDGVATTGYTPMFTFSEEAPRGTELSKDLNKHLKLWAQKVATQFELKAPQFLELGMLIDVGKNLETRDLHLRIWQQATSYKILNGVEEIKVELMNMKAVVEMATARLRRAFQLTADQMMQILIMSKDMLVQAGQTKYKALHVDVEASHY